MDCVLKSFAYCIDMEPDELMAHIGHNGREIINPGLPEPYCYRAFDVYEMSRVLFDLGWTVTTIMKYDTVYNAMMIEPKFLCEAGDRIRQYLEMRRYCLASDNHMIGVHDGKILDLMGIVTRPEDFNYKIMYIIEQSWS